jgi:hypothetical protein
MRVRVRIVEEVTRGRRVTFHERPDLAFVVEAELPSDAKKVAKLGMKDDTRFAGLEVASVNFEGRRLLHVIVRKKPIRQEISGIVYKAPAGVRR